MNRATVLPTLAVATLLLIAAPPAAAQSETGRGAEATVWTPQRLPDGQPNMSGMWDNTRALFTPLELPEELTGQDPSADELRSRAQAQGDQLVAAGEWKGFENSRGVGAYGFHWFDWFFDEREDIGQPALVVQPASGRVPDRTVTARELLARTAIEQFDAAERMDADDRCITRGPSGMFPTHVNNGKLILQIPGYVIVHAEMIHNTRIIPIETAHVDEKIRLWNGDPRGRWEGDTLVVESSNFRTVDHIRGTSPSDPSRQTEAQRLTERFTLAGPDLLLYSVTIDDANTYSDPWTVAFPFDRESDYLQFEFACHEGNYAVPTALRGGRAQEAPEQR